MPLRYEHLSKMEREYIAVNIRKGRSLNSIADSLGRAVSTISREVRRNGLGTVYLHRRAHRKALKRRHRPRRLRILDDAAVRREVELRLKAYWSPEQIGGRWKLKKGRSVVSRTTIYRMIHEDPARWLRYLRGPPRRKKKYERIRERKMIDQRPVEVARRSRCGDWESDSIRGPIRSPAGLMTHVERATKYLVSGLLADRKASTFNALSKKLLASLPVLTLTVDNGMEFGCFKELEQALGADVYFAHEKCPWERGLNENTNRLLRQFFPRGTNFAAVSPAQLSRAVDLLNSRPRKSLGYRTPKEAMIEAGVALVT